MNSYKHNQPTFDSAKKELGEKQFNKKLQTVFGLQVLNYVKTIVINLPGSCYANCPYCIDNSLRNHCTDIKTFLASCEKTFQEFYWICSPLLGHCFSFGQLCQGSRKIL